VTTCWDFSAAIFECPRHNLPWPGKVLRQTLTAQPLCARGVFTGLLQPWEHRNVMGTILLVLLILLLVGAIPAWPYSTGWGYYPSGGLGLVLLVVLILVLMGRI
jgi:hypothetical protein